MLLTKTGLFITFSFSALKIVIWKDCWLLTGYMNLVDFVTRVRSDFLYYISCGGSSHLYVRRGQSWLCRFDWQIASCPRLCRRHVDTTHPYCPHVCIPSLVPGKRVYTPLWNINPTLRNHTWLATALQANMMSKYTCSLHRLLYLRSWIF